jgi:hypothetical protein
MKVKIAQDVHDRWDKFFEVLQIEKDELMRMNWQETPKGPLNGND